MGKAEKEWLFRSGLAHEGSHWKVPLFVLQFFTSMNISSLGASLVVILQLVPNISTGFGWVKLHQKRVMLFDVHVPKKMGSKEQAVILPKVYALERKWD